MIGSEGNAYNLLFVVPILVALIGSIATRFRAAAWLERMLAAAAVHVAVALGGIPVDPRGVVFQSAFIAFWLVAAAFFSRRSRQGTER